MGGTAPQSRTQVMTRPRAQAAIGVDASRAVLSVRTGTEHYAAALLQALAALPEVAARSFVLYVNLTDERTATERLGFELPPAWSVRAIPFPRLWTHARLSAEMVTRRPGVLFVPSHVVPLVHPRRTVVTVHDLGYLYYPEAHTRFSRLYLHLSTMYSARVARRVIAISEATKRDLIERYRIQPQKIRVVYHGCDEAFAPVLDPMVLQAASAKYGIEGAYCLHVGTLQPRKNLGLLVEAWDILRERMASPPRLLLAGKRGWLYESLVRSVEERGLGDLIRFADYVERADLPALYSGALALTFPSLYEGFGLPALEAMSCGTPVIASNVSSIPEVVGDAGLLLDPHDAAAWAGAVDRLAAAEVARRDMSRLGMERAAGFTWERCARETYAVLTGK
jgi:glycosyltransferase involved in cell wall biosynthesis